MSAKPPARGLGRGLDALFSDADPDAPAAQGGEGVRTLPISLMTPNPGQPRRRFAEDELEGLAQSIRENGLIQPILVRPLPGDDEHYQIVAGERRWRAAQQAGLHEAPVLVRELDDREVLEIALVENLQRADLNPIEEAAAYQVLKDNFKRRQEDISRAVGRSRSHVANTLRLLDLPKSVRAYLETGELSAGHARAIGGAPDIAALAERIVAEGLSVREAEKLARAAQAGEDVSRPKPPPAEVPDIDAAALADDMARQLGMRVEVRHKDGKGEMVIRYDTLEQLDEVCRRLTLG